MSPLKRKSKTSYQKAELFLEFLSVICDIPETMRNRIIKNSLAVKLYKGELLPTEMLKSNVIFINIGAIRGFIHEKDKDVTLMISQENQLIGSSNLEIFSRTDYALTYQALEDCCLLALPFSLLYLLRERHKQMSLINDHFIWRYHSEATERNLLSRLPTAMLRYSRLMQTDPGLFDRVPDKYLSSYLVMRQETLSRLRRTKKNI
ncbi:hypothetical protein OQZ33_13300 [Pedobacter sp. MC2016-05]|uniref:Crp/Fnr family transcriptional regulator n=1 Tax=Pedobacter sp. MC2016-05 TaxID=2994474 RepID=UPI0022486FBD|nr:hypothetical protein [Pedobacter sp. MC2016-05]MCX2475307.1 hypothetical protein [Pedobacter sp. MC2016-05]